MRWVSTALLVIYEKYNCTLQLSTQTEIITFVENFLICSLHPPTLPLNCSLQLHQTRFFLPLNLIFLRCHLVHPLRRHLWHVSSYFFWNFIVSFRLWFCLPLLFGSFPLIYYSSPSSPLPLVSSNTLLSSTSSGVLSSVSGFMSSLAFNTSLLSSYSSSPSITSLTECLARSWLQTWVKIDAALFGPVPNFNMDKEIDAALTLSLSANILTSLFQSLCSVASVFLILAFLKATFPKDHLQTLLWVLFKWGLTGTVAVCVGLLCLVQYPYTDFQNCNWYM